MPSTTLKTTPRYSWQFDAIGTKWEIVTQLLISGALRKTIEYTIEEFDATYSRFRSDSLISKMAETPGEYLLPENSELIFNFYDELWDITHHKVTPTIGSTLALAGYDATYSLKQSESIDPVKNYQEVIRRDGLTFSLKSNVLLDIGAVGKGYLVDRISQILQESGHDTFVVDGSGDMRVSGKYNETVGLENPRDDTEVIGTIDFSDRAFCASAVNRRAWGEWHHIIDPTTNQPVRDIIATWVLADSAMIADGLATALFFVSPEKLATRYTYEYMRMHADGGVEYSNYFSKGIF